MGSGGPRCSPWGKNTHQGKGWSSDTGIPASRWGGLGLLSLVPARVLQDRPPPSQPWDRPPGPSSAPTRGSLDGAVHTGLGAESRAQGTCPACARDGDGGALRTPTQGKGEEQEPCGCCRGLLALRVALRCKQSGVFLRERPVPGIFQDAAATAALLPVGGCSFIRKSTPASRGYGLRSSRNKSSDVRFRQAPL